MKNFYCDGRDFLFFISLSLRIFFQSNSFNTIESWLKLIEKIVRGYKLNEGDSFWFGLAIDSYWTIFFVDCFFVEWQ